MQEALTRMVAETPVIAMIALTILTQNNEEET